VRLKGGDPFIFGRGGEEAEILVENKIPFEIIPGITSGIGAANYSGIPLTHRKYGSAVAFVTGHEDPDKKTPEVNWDKLSEAVDTVVIYMGTEKLELILNKIKGGKIDDRTPIVVIGHPSGLPTKIAGGAKVRDNSNDIFFSANLDTFGGNSGSAVFNEKSGEVVGILVRGENDYVNDKDRECQVVNKCADNECRGEDVTRIENIRQLKTILRERGV
jgi:hypothetical protein